jgi:hypothetical protein
MPDRFSYKETSLAAVSKPRARNDKNSLEKGDFNVGNKLGYRINKLISSKE